ncbi:MAG: YjjG family noncanonical pyrimidine nucleotidase [Acidobacteria bacterium]|nr:YjjG family noncanonical pyrimidine nucleotidase [Acidobacteriota bacterium]
MTCYEWILFDADNTLLDYDRGQKYALNSAFADFGVTRRVDRYLVDYNRINAEFWVMFEKQEVTAGELRVARFARLFRENGLDLDAAAFSRVYLDYLSRADFLLPDALATVRYCRDKYRLALLSNGLAEVQHARYRRAGLDKLFPVRVVSEEIGVPKPDPRIFAATLDLCDHHDKSTVLMVGDNPGSDIIGGQRFGIDTCWFNRTGAAAPADIRPTYEISKLAELRAII